MIFEETRRIVEISTNDFLNIIEHSGIYDFLNNVDFNKIKGYDRFEQRNEIYEIALDMLKRYFTDKSIGSISYGENYSANGIGNNSRKPIYLTEDNIKYSLGYISIMAGIFREMSISFQDNDLKNILPTIERQGYQGIR